MADQLDINKYFYTLNSKNEDVALYLDNMAEERLEELKNIAAIYNNHNSKQINQFMSFRYCSIIMACLAKSFDKNQFIYYGGGIFNANNFTFPNNKRGLGFQLNDEIEEMLIIMFVTDPNLDLYKLKETSRTIKEINLKAEKHYCFSNPKLIVLEIIYNEFLKRKKSGTRTKVKKSD